jgi:hypothetical protein
VETPKAHAAWLLRNSNPATAQLPSAPGSAKSDGSMVAEVRP